MFDNKSLQLASYGHLDYYYFQSFLSQFENASLVNLNGDLLFSKDTDLCCTTTSRLVAYQIVKKYLTLNPGDIFITNDPENGGYNYSKIFFISALTSNLFLIWSEDLPFIQFKIPLSPIVENHKKNALLWQAMIDAHPEKNALNIFFNAQIENYTSCYSATPYLDFLSEPELQKIWFNNCKEEFHRQFDLRAQGQSEISIKYNDKLIKVALRIEEKQNQRTINIDFSNTHLAESMCAASHVIESAMIQEFVYHYKLHQYLSQPILNQIKLIMPPKSIVSKAHSTGRFNFELQCLIKQIFKHLLQQLNSGRKTDQKFQIKSEAQLNFHENSKIKNAYLLDQTFRFDDIADFFTANTMSMKDNIYRCDLKPKESKKISLSAHVLASEKDISKRTIQINDQPVSSGHFELTDNDLLSISWKLDS